MYPGCLVVRYRGLSPHSEPCGRPGLVVTRISCNREFADKTANANYSACSSIYLSMSCIISREKCHFKEKRYYSQMSVYLQVNVYMYP